jgi:hypothetical protein
MAEKCPGCGARLERDPQWATAFACGSHFDETPGAIYQSPDESLCETSPCLKRQRTRLLSAFHAAINRPKGIIPDDYLDLYDQEHPALERDNG